VLTKKNEFRREAGHTGRGNTPGPGGGGLAGMRRGPQGGGRARLGSTGAGGGPGGGSGGGGLVAQPMVSPTGAAGGGPPVTPPGMPSGTTPQQWQQPPLAAPAPVAPAVNPLAAFLGFGDSAASQQPPPPGPSAREAPREADAVRALRSGNAMKDLKDFFGM